MAPPPDESFKGRAPSLSMTTGLTCGGEIEKEKRKRGERVKRGSEGRGQRASELTFLEEGEHGVHVHQSLAGLSVDGAEEVEGQ